MGKSSKKKSITSSSSKNDNNVASSASPPTTKNPNNVDNNKKNVSREKGRITPSSSSAKTKPESTSETSDWTLNWQFLMVALLVGALAVWVQLDMYDKPRRKERQKQAEHGHAPSSYPQPIFSKYAPSVVPFMTTTPKPSSQDSDDTSDPPTGFSMKFAMGERSQKLELLDQWFPNKTLDKAWEVHPLLSTIHPPPDKANNSIPTVAIHNRTHQQARLQKLQRLFTYDHIPEVLYPKQGPNLKHGSDYRVVQKVIRDGAEWSGMVPGEALHPTQVQMYLKPERGFSLILNKLERRWTSVAKLARQLQREVATVHVNANLYLTPKPSAESDNAKELGTDDTHLRQSGFESHWDGMDVLVVQLVGQKLWSVAKQPHIYLGVKDQKYKPSLAELQAGYSAQHRYEDFLLREGDVLYIPRGWIHNASTVDAADDKADYSMHVTFGLEHGCETTVEALVHHAIEAHSGFEDDSGKSNDQAVALGQCRTDRAVVWKDVLHLVVSEVARRETTCQDAPYSRTSTCFLRKAVPLTGAMEELMGTASREEGLGNMLQKWLNHALTIVSEQLDLPKTANWVQRLEASDGENIRSFCYPGISMDKIAPCPPQLERLSAKALKTYVGQLQAFAKTSGHRAVSLMKSLVDKEVAKILQEEDRLLRSTGQEVAISLEQMKSLMRKQG